MSSEPADSHRTMETGEHAILEVKGWENLPKEVIATNSEGAHSAWPGTWDTPQVDDEGGLVAVRVTTVCTFAIGGNDFLG